jgi:hypothetical protein
MHSNRALNVHKLSIVNTENEKFYCNTFISYLEATLLLAKIQQYLLNKQCILLLFLSLKLCWVFCLYIAVTDMNFKLNGGMLFNLHLKNLCHGQTS